MDGYIPKEKLTAWERWELAAFDEQRQEEAAAVADAVAAEAAEGPEAAGTPEPVPALPSAEDIERWRAEAHESGHREGYAAGFEAGRVDGEAATRAEAERLANLAADFTRALETLENRLAEDLLAVAVELARQVLRTSLEVRRELILPVVREAMAMLPAQHGHPTLLLHPDDAALVRTQLAEQIAHGGWRLSEDPALGRGCCRIESAGSHVDATLATRWQRVIETLGARSDWLGKDA